MNGVTNDAVRLRLFPFSLRDRAKSWLISMEANSITTWQELTQKNLAKFFPPSLSARYRGEINNFHQKDGESLYDAWERFKELLRKCPHHGIEKWMLVHIFYNGLCGITRTIIDAAFGGAFMSKSANEAYDLLEEMAMNNYQWPSERETTKKVAGVHELDAISMFSAQVATLTKQLQQNNIHAQAPVMQMKIKCELCGGPHLFEQCTNRDFNNIPMEQVQAIGNFPRPSNNPYSMSYNPGWRNHPNFSWTNGQGSQQQFQQNQPQYPRPPPGFYQQQPVRPAQQQMQAKQDGQADVLTQFMTETRSSIRSLETQIGQLATLMANQAQGNLPSTTEVNPKGNPNEQCQAITLRSGTVYEGISVEKRVEQKQDQHAPNVEDKKTCEEKVKEIPPAREVVPPVSIDHHRKIPYPQRLQKNRLDKQFAKFLEVFKRLHINIPFAEALEQMPSYVKFMKDILSKKRKMEDYETVALTEECSAILQRKLPQKLRDLGSFTIPRTIGNFECKHALCGLGASINLMPLSVFKRLGLGEAKPTTITLQLADQSLAHPRGIIEDVLVKVDKFIFPADFIVLDMEEDANVPIILGRPFLGTGQALIDVQKGELKLRVEGDEVVFSVFKAMAYPMASDSCYSVDVIDKAVLERRVSSDALEAVLTGGEEDEDDDEMKEYVKWINSYHPYLKKFEELAEAIDRPLTSIQ
ncbi:uncharacterized protein LOC133782950 [Humulus lupulus]|uniref:uncharacterized protein LOC133782950 n=1 Tax=Humulus lupulus TaxID=3486 RepID=UPI002B414828|nr:uncharacterized protein LOC133782950 [Humulus lupulus]